MRGLWSRAWVRYVLVVVVLAAGIAAFVIVRAERRDAQLSDNRAQLARACRGLLPAAELRRWLPADSAGELAEFGLLFDGRPSRSLLDCALMWGADADKWEPDAEVRLRAVAALPGEESALSPQDSDEAVGNWATPRGAHGEVTYDSTLDGGRVTAWLRLHCPSGLTGRVRPTKDLRIRVDYPVRADFASELSAHDRLTPARTAVRAANWVLAKQHCTGPRLPRPAEVVAE